MTVSRMRVECRGPHHQFLGEQLDGVEEVRVEVGDATITVNISNHRMVMIYVEAPNRMFSDLKFDPDSDQPEESTP